MNPEEELIYVQKRLAGRHLFEAEKKDPKQEWWDLSVADQEWYVNRATME